MHVSDGIALNHLDRMTDSTGLIQHAIYSIPRRESGYTTDDNARALRLCTRLWEQQPGERMLGRVTTYLSFLEHARCPVRGFHNFLSYQRDWLDAEGTGDSQGQAVRALAEVLGSSLPDGYRLLGAGVDRRGLARAGRPAEPAGAGLRDLGVGTSVDVGREGHRSARERRLVRGAAAGGMLPPFPTAGLAVVRVADDLRERGVAARPVHCRPVLAGGGFSRRGGSVVRLPGPRDHRHRKGSGVFCRNGPKGAAHKRLPTPFRLLWPVGNSDWYPHGENKSPYDQQPVEAVTMADAALAAFGPLGDVGDVALKNTWLPSAAPTAGSMAGTASANHSSTSAAAPAATAFNPPA